MVDPDLAQEGVTKRPKRSKKSKDVTPTDTTSLQTHNKNVTRQKPNASEDNLSDDGSEDAYRGPHKKSKPDDKVVPNKKVKPNRRVL